MPKKQPKSKLLNGEGAPPPSSFSLADFLVPTANKGTVKKSTSQINGAQDLDFPALVGAKSNQLVASQDCWSKISKTNLVPVCSLSQPVVVVSSPPETVSSPSVSTYMVAKTKKGGLPIRVENRSKGKKVTVIFNVTGNLKELLSELKHAAGTGGVVKDDTVEVQGDKMEFVEKFLKAKFKKLSN